MAGVSVLSYSITLHSTTPNHTPQPTTQVSTLLGMFLREPDFQSRLQIQGGQLANLFFKLQMLGYMFANADRVLSASSALNLKEAPRRPPVGKVEGTVAVSMGVRVVALVVGVLVWLALEVGAIKKPNTHRSYPIYPHDHHRHPTGTTRQEGRNVTVQAKDLLGNLVREVEALREGLDRAKLNREVSRQSVSRFLVFWGGGGVCVFWLG